MLVLVYALATLAKPHRCQKRCCCAWCLVLAGLQHSTERTKCFEVMQASFELMHLSVVNHIPRTHPGAVLIRCLMRCLDRCQDLINLIKLLCLVAPRSCTCSRPESTCQLHTPSLAMVARNLGSIRDELDVLQQSITDCKERTARLELSVQRRDQVHLRSLLDRSRHILAGGELPVDQRSAWNTRIQDGTVVAPPGVSDEAVKLTKYTKLELGRQLEAGVAREHAAQQAGNAAQLSLSTRQGASPQGQLQGVGAQHDSSAVSIAVIAGAVLSQPLEKCVLYDQLFTMCFHKSADDVFADLLPPVDTSDDEC